MKRSDSDPRRLVRRGYDVLGGRYHEWTSANDPRYRLDHLEQLVARLEAGSRVLELGCGPGLPVAQELAPDHVYVGVDVSLTQLRLSRANAPCALLVLADMDDLAFAPASFDAVVAFYSIIHVPRAAHADLFGRIADWLRPGGLFVANLGARDDPGSTDDWIDGVEMFWSSFDAATNEQLLADSGFELERSEVLKNFEDGREVEFLWVVAASV